MTRARDVAEWVPAGTPTVGEGILVTQADPRVITAYAAGSIPFNAVIHVRDTQPPAENTGDGVFWLNPTVPELRVHLAGNWLQVSVPDADAEGVMAIAGAGPAHDWLTTDDIDLGTY